MKIQFLRKLFTLLIVVALTPPSCRIPLVECQETTISLDDQSSIIFDNDNNNNNNNNTANNNGRTNIGSTVGEELFLNSNVPIPEIESQDNAVDVPATNENPNIPEALNVVGLLFNVRSRISNGTLFITGMEFYTSMSGSLFYELYTKNGSFREEKDALGDVTKFESLSGGLVVGPGTCSDVDERAYDAPEAAFDTPAGEIATIQMMGDTFNTLNTSLDSRSLTCPLAPIPKDDFIDGSNSNEDASSRPYYRWTIPPNGTRAFYLTLASNNLLVKPSTTPDPADSIIAASTQELDLYEGIATKTYPFSKDENFYYDGAMKFMGRIHYRVEYIIQVETTIPETETEIETDMPSFVPTSSSYGPTADGDNDGSEQSEEGAVLSSVPTPLGSSARPTEPLASNAPTITPHPTTATPSLSTHPTASSSPSQEPSEPPVKRCRPGRPCLPPPTPPPTANPTVPLPPIDYSQLDPMTIELIVTVENVPERIMNDREIEHYEEVMTTWLSNNAELEKNGVALNQTTMFYHNLLENNEGRGGGGSKGLGRDFGNNGRFDDNDNTGNNGNTIARARTSGSGSSGGIRPVHYLDIVKGGNIVKHGHVPKQHGSKTADTNRRNRQLLSSSEKNNDEQNSTSPDAYIYNYNTQLPKSKFAYTPQTFPAIYIMTKLDVYSTLPYDVVAFFLWNEYMTHESSLLELFHTQSLFVSYFRNAERITVQMVDDLSFPPTVAPTKASDVVAVDEEEAAEEKAGFQRDQL